MDAFNQAQKRINAIRAAKEIVTGCRAMGGDWVTLERVSIRLNYELYEAQDALHDARRAQAVAHV